MRWLQQVRQAWRCGKLRYCRSWIGTPLTADVANYLPSFVMRTAKFIVQREGNANNKYFASIFFSQTIHAGNAASGLWFTNDQCGKTIVRGTMDAGINNVIYMELYSGPKMANSTCGKTIVAGTIDQFPLYSHMPSTWPHSHVTFDRAMNGSHSWSWCGS